MSIAEVIFRAEMFLLIYIVHELPGGKDNFCGFNLRAH